MHSQTPFITFEITHGIELQVALEGMVSTSCFALHVSIYYLIITVYLTACPSGIWTTTICRSFLWPSGHWANFRNCESTHTHTLSHTHTNPPAWHDYHGCFIPSNPVKCFNVALGYNLSRLKQVLPRIPRHKHTHTRTHTQTRWSARMHTVFFFSFNRCSQCECVSACECVFTSHLSKKKKCFSAVQWQVQHEDIWLHSCSQTHHLKKNNWQMYAKSNMFSD